MADPYLSDEERVELIKQWWKENGKYIITGVLIALLSVFAFFQWKKYKHGQAELALNEFVELRQIYLKSDFNSNKVNVKNQAQTDKKDSNKETLKTDVKVKPLVEIKSEKLIREYSNSPIAVDSALLLAKVKVLQKDLKGAQAQLQWVLDNTSDNSFKNHVARLRLARVLRDNGSLDKALALLMVKHPDEFGVYYNYVKGTIYEQQNKCGNARTSYKNSIKILSDEKKKKADVTQSQSKFKELIEHRLENVVNC